VHGRPGGRGVIIVFDRRFAVHVAAVGRLIRHQGSGEPILSAAVLRLLERQCTSTQEGFTSAGDRIRHALWVNRNADTEAPLEGFLPPDTVKAIYTTGHPDLSKISTDNWDTELFFLSRPHAHRVQLDLSQGRHVPMLG